MDEHRDSRFRFGDLVVSEVLMPPVEGRESRGLFYAEILELPGSESPNSITVAPDELRPLAAILVQLAEAYEVPDDA